MRRRLPRGLPLVADVALAVAALLFIAEAWRAWHLPPLPAAVRPSPAAEPVLAGAARDGAGTTRIAELGLAGDPFSPDRSLPAAMPAADAPRDEPLADAPPVRLLGTVVRGAAGFALCQVASEPPRTIRVGEAVGTLTLVALDQGRATFRAADGRRVELTLTPPGT